MTTAAEGILSDAVDRARKMLAASSRWQTMADADDESQGFDRTYVDSIPDPADGREYTVAELQQLRPFAIFHTLKAHSVKRAEGSVAAWAFTGQVEIEIHQDLGGSDPIENLDEKMRRFENDVGVIWQELLTLAETTSRSDLLAIQEIDMGEPYLTTLEKYVGAQGREVVAVLTLDWGIE